MARKTKTLLARIEDAPLTDVLGGVWLVTVLLGLLHLPSVIV